MQGIKSSESESSLTLDIEPIYLCSLTNTGLAMNWLMSLMYYKTSLSLITWSTCFISATDSFCNTLRAQNLFWSLLNALWTFPKLPTPTVHWISKSEILGLYYFFFSGNFFMGLVGEGQSGSCLLIPDCSLRFWLNYSKILWVC